MIGSKNKQALFILPSTDLSKLVLMNTSLKVITLSLVTANNACNGSLDLFYLNANTYYLLLTMLC